MLRLEGFGGIVVFEGDTYGELAHDGLKLFRAQQFGIAEKFQLCADGAKGAVRGCRFNAHFRCDMRGQDIYIVVLRAVCV